MISGDSPASGVEEDGAPQVVGDVTQLRSEPDLILFAVHFLLGRSLRPVGNYNKFVNIMFFLTS